jgi:hypothetical protein
LMGLGPRVRVMAPEWAWRGVQVGVGSQGCGEHVESHSAAASDW